MKRQIALTNGTIITPMQEIINGTLLIDGERIQDLGSNHEVRVPEEAEVIDVNGGYISPGFIDLHLHGAWGGDVMGASLDNLRKMSEGLVKNGVTSFFPTTLSGPLTRIEESVACIEEATNKELGGAKVLGAHLEGPYFSMEQKGAQNPLYIIDPKPEDYLPMLDKYPCISRVTAAPELPGGLEFGQELKRRGIIASIGHSNATYQEVLKAVEYGYSHVTHIFSGMSGLHRVNAYRISGVIESTLLIDELTTEMIADGHHLPPSLMKLVLKAKGLDKVCVASDSMMAAGLGAGQFNLGGLDVVVEADIPEQFEIPSHEMNFVAKLTDRSSFASSVATMDQLVRNMVRLVGLSVKDAVKLATLTPTKMQRLEGQIGILAKGMKADIVVFDSDIRVFLTMVNGKVVHVNEEVMRKG